MEMKLLGLCPVSLECNQLPPCLNNFLQMSSLTAGEAGVLGISFKGGKPRALKPALRVRT